jgi:hypothetical protein
MGEAMRKVFLIGILGIVTAIGNTSAQVPPSECGGVYFFLDSCRFTCQAGDFIAVLGTMPSGAVDVYASCGSVSVVCGGYGYCTAQSVTAVAQDSENGSCNVYATTQCGKYWCKDYDFGEYWCAGVTREEAAELKASGQALVIQIPEK